MKIDLDGLKRIFQAYVSTKEPPSRTNCPTPEDMIRSFEPSVPFRKKKKIVDHLSECSFCRGEFMILFEMHRTDASHTVEGSYADDGRRFGEARRWLSSAIWQYACVILGISLVAFSGLLLDHQKEIRNVQRSLELDIVLLSPVSNKAPTDPLVFLWKAKMASEYYVLELFDDALLSIWISDRIYDEQASLPPAIRANLEPGRSYYWMVTAFIGNLKVEESALARFMICK